MAIVLNQQFKMWELLMQATLLFINKWMIWDTMSYAHFMQNSNTVSSKGHNSVEHNKIAG